MSPTRYNTDCRDCDNCASTFQPSIICPGLSGGGSGHCCSCAKESPRFALPSWSTCTRRALALSWLPARCAALTRVRTASSAFGCSRSTVLIWASLSVTQTPSLSSKKPSPWRSSPSR
ncbi:hypothetical protein D3C81_1542020 [compost metagenome]